MCLGCNCPQPIVPPNDKLKKCRTMLQALAVGLLVLGMIGIACSLIFQFFYNLLLVYMLYIGWTTFNWCMVLTFFLFCTIQTLMATITFVGLLQYQQLFANKQVLASIYCTFALIYYPIAVYFSHYCYKNFKSHFLGNNQIFPVNNQGGNPQQVQQNQGYHAFRQGQGALRPQNQRQPVNQNNVFQGQGVRIG